MKTRNYRHFRLSGTAGDKSSRKRRVPDYCDGRRSFPTYENINFDVGDMFGALSSQSNWQKHWKHALRNQYGGLEQLMTTVYLIIADFTDTSSKQLGRSENNAIPAHLGFSRHIKPSLKNPQLSPSCGFSCGSLLRMRYLWRQTAAAISYTLLSLINL